MTYTVRTIGFRIMRYKTDSVVAALGFAYGWNHSAASGDGYVEVVDAILIANERPDVIHSTNEPEGR